MFAVAPDIRRGRGVIVGIRCKTSAKGESMDRWQWLLQMILTCAALVRLLVTGRRNGWI
jgi:hypothetical protein